ncbi:MAG TPA: septal ring lytic transglycosylase RlpA family protein [Longimicrobiales bacterium]|nr:septal ring lytic transglycosylase RlpA family protein [Longimicrobiales bacterium]
MRIRIAMLSTIAALAGIAPPLLAQGVGASGDSLLGRVAPPRDSVTARGHRWPILRTLVGKATYYSSRFQGRESASGAIYDERELVAAHRTMPFGTLLRVTNLANGRAVTVKVIDRGPHGSPSRIIDLSRRAADELGFIARGIARVKVEVLRWGRTPRS